MSIFFKIVLVLLLLEVPVSSDRNTGAVQVLIILAMIIGVIGA